MRPIRLRGLVANLTYRARSQGGVRALRQEWKASRGARRVLAHPDSRQVSRNSLFIMDADAYLLLHRW
jgi:hypothetical protein